MLNITELNDDILYHIVQLVCEKSYAVVSVINKRFYKFFVSERELPKVTSIYYMLTPSDAKLYFSNHEKQDKHNVSSSALYNGIARSVVDDENEGLIDWALSLLATSSTCSIKSIVDLYNEIMWRSAFLGKLHLLQRFDKIYKRISSRSGRSIVCSSAAKGGRLDVLKYLRSRGYEWNEVTCSNAVEYGHLNVLKWVREHNCPWWERILCDKAARGGSTNIEMMKWLIMNTYSRPSEKSCEEASRKGDLLLLRWLRGESEDDNMDREVYPWNQKKCFLLAKEHNHENVLEWIHEVGHDSNDFEDY